MENQFPCPHFFNRSLVVMLLLALLSVFLLMFAVVGVDVVVDVVVVPSPPEVVTPSSLK